MEKQGKLELTWVGKYQDERLEPRILIQDISKSYGDAETENILIHGDNLLALKALEKDYAGKIKCIYIDPHIIPALHLSIMTTMLNIVFG